MSEQRKIQGFSIRTKLTLVLFVVALLPLLILNWKSFLSAEKALKDSTLSGLNMSAEYKAGEVYLYIETLKTNARDFASDGFIKNAVKKQASDASMIDALVKHLQQNKLPIQDDLLFIDILDAQGTIVASTKPERIGMLQSNRAFFQKGIQNIYVSDVDYNSNKQLSGAIAVPLKANEKNAIPIGVLVNHYRMDKLKKLFSGQLVVELGARTNYRQLSSSESIYLVNQQGYMVTSSTKNLVQESQIKIDSYPVDFAKQHNRHTSGIWDNHLGIPVVGVSSIIEIDDFKFLLLAEKEITDAFKHIEKLKIESYLLLVFTIMAVLLVSWLLAYIFVMPLEKLMKCIDAVSTGKFDIEIENIRSKDEFGLLAKKFVHMTREVKNMHAELVNKNGQLYELSIRDEMTGLYNQRHLHEKGAYFIADALRYKRPLSCLMIDIDHFKQINDSFGHPFGDIVLIDVAHLLRNQLRVNDIISRYGGEEFAVLLPETSSFDAIKVAEKIRKKIASHLFNHGGIVHKVTVSIGVAEFTSKDGKLKQLISRADEALYQSKENGRNRVSISSPMDYRVEKVG